MITVVSDDRSSDAGPAGVGCAVRRRVTGRSVVSGRGRSSGVARRSNAAAAARGQHRPQRQRRAGSTSVAFNLMGGNKF